MAAKPDTAKLTKTLSDLEDYLPTVRYVPGLAACQTANCTLSLGAPSLRSASLRQCVQVPDEVTAHVLKVHGAQLQDPRL